MEKKKEKKVTVKSKAKKPLANKISAKAKAEPHAPSMLVFERIKSLLDKQNRNVEWLAKEVGLKNKSTLYVAFKKGSVSMVLLQKIASVFGIKPFYFFENDIIERLTEEIAKHPQNPDLKSFLMGFSRDVSKGLSIEQAAYKNIDPHSYTTGLVI